MKNAISWLAGPLVLVLSHASWASSGTDGILSQLQADDLKVVQAGEKVYQAQCAACHGEMLEGQPEWRKRQPNGMLPAPPHDASGHTWHHADDLLFEITKFGPGVVIGDPDYKTMMPAFSGILSDDDIVAVLSFIKNTWPADQRQWQDDINDSQTEGFLPERKKSGLLEKLLK